MKTIKTEPIDLPNCSSITANQSSYLDQDDQITKSKINSSKESLAHPEQELITCAWCQKLGHQSFILRTDNGDSRPLCNEICFNQYRRASFKQNKDPKLSKIHQIIKAKVKLTDSHFRHHGETTEKRSKPTVIETHHRRKIFSPSSQSKHPRLSSFHEKPSSTVPINLTSFLPPPPPINRFPYPFFTPPSSSLQQLPSISEQCSSTLIPTLTKSLISNYTCILPSFIPLPIPIPIPLCLPIHSSCRKCSTDVSNQECQTEFSKNSLIDSFQMRRMSY